MVRYRKRGGHSVIAGYSLGEDSIDIWFIDGALRHYSAERDGAAKVAAMRARAEAGDGLFELCSGCVADSLAG